MFGWGIGTRLNFAFALLIALIVGLGLAGAELAQRVARDVNESVVRGAEKSDRFASLRETARDIHLAYATAAASAISKDVSNARALERQFGEIQSALAGGLDSTQRKGVDDELALVSKTGRLWVDRAVEARIDNSNQMGGEGSPAELSLQFKRATDRLEAHLDAIVAEERSKTSSVVSALGDDLDRGSRWFFLGVLVCVAIAIASALSIRRSIVRPIAELTRVAHRIASEGDLTQSIDTSRRDEVGRLASALHELVRRLREIPVDLATSVASLQGAVEEMDEAFVEQQITFTKQAAAIQQTQVTLQEIRQTSQVAAEKANAVVKSSERANEISRSGEQALVRSVEGLSLIRSGFTEIADRISLLKTKTTQISGITSTVKDIADQSSMLALNAAIEAVRSGEHGRGFSVVAREIRNLADQSIESTRQVGDALSDIGRAIGEAVSITEQGEKKIAGGVHQVTESGQHMRELAGIVRDSTATVRQIAAAVGQQNEGVSQLFMAVTEVSAMMDASRKRIENTTTARDKMKQASERVAAVVRTFRV